MDIFLNPKISPAHTLLLAIVFIGGGVALSTTRLETVAAEKNSNDIAQYRANICRILSQGEKVELGAYYFQPTQTSSNSISGTLLSEGVYICDPYGGTARIERGGYAQHVVTATDIATLNKTLQRRLSESANPDSSELSRVRRATNLGTYRPQPQDQAPDQFFNLN